MTLDKRINAFVLLGEFLKQFLINEKNDSLNSINSIYYDEFEELILRQKSYNGWFEKENVLESIDAIANYLTKSELEKWLVGYDLSSKKDRRVGVIMAGNIPLVGFHDFLSVLITGNILLAKLSSSDNTLLKKIAQILIDVEPDFKNKIHFVDKLNDFDAVIATGSNNSARYFDYYFGKYPHIIRRNRNSVAIINEKDTLHDLKELGKDIFRYFGLGCRNVSKIYIPEGYIINNFFEAILEDFQNVTQNNKYANNYDYNKAVYLLGNNQLLDNDFLLLKEDKELASPVGMLYYEYYTSLDKLQNHLNGINNQIQCIVSSKNTPMNTLTFGEAQKPSLNDYADGIDTIQFLIGLN